MLLIFQSFLAENGIKSEMRVDHLTTEYFHIYEENGDVSVTYFPMPDYDYAQHFDFHLSDESCFDKILIMIQTLLKNPSDPWDSRTWYGPQSVSEDLGQC